MGSTHEKAAEMDDKTETWIRGEGNKVNRMVSVVNDWHDAVQQFQSMDHLINALRELIRMFNQIKSARDPDAL